MRADCNTYKENDRDVEKEGNHSVSDEDEDSDSVEVLHGERWDFQEESNDAIHHRACRRKVVKRYKRVHFEFGRAEKALDKSKTNGLEDDATALEDESNKDELNLAKGMQ